MRNRALRALGLAAGLLWALPAAGAATVTVLNFDGPGEGFNDPTPVAPVGGNPGATLGQQRLIAFQHAANLWGAQLTSVVPILIRARFDPLSCTATSAVMGSATALAVFHDFAGAPVAGHLYPVALANKLAGTDLFPPSSGTDNEDITARFNSSLGQLGCLTGSFFYLGLDSTPPVGQVDLVTVLLHELAHGLGFETTTNASTGAFLVGFPHIFDRLLFDTSTGELWDGMTDAERVAAAINPRAVVWTGANVNAAIPSVLQEGTPELAVLAPAGLAGSYLVGTASFGAPLTPAGVSGQLMDPLDDPLGCLPFLGLDALALNGNVALIQRGTCPFADKVRHAQNAGAIAVVIDDHTPGSPPDGLGGFDPLVVIPSVFITQADGALLRDALRFRSRTRSGVVVDMRIDPSVRAGADPANRMLMSTPDPLVGGSSLEHWDSSATPNQLMEPALSQDLTHSVLPPQDLTLPALFDLGW